MKSSDFFRDARVRFFRVEAEAMRWREQLQMIGAEFGRTVRYFESFAKIWTKMAVQHQSDAVDLDSGSIADVAQLGRQAYALKRAHWNEFWRAGVLARFKDTAKQCNTLQDWAQFDWGTS